MTLSSLTCPTDDAPLSVCLVRTESASIANEVPADSFVTGISSVVGLSAVQKVVGFLRTIIFLRLLTDDQMGRWSLVALFLCTAAPLTVLGLPGTFGKYVEYFRQRGQLRAFLRRTTAICVVLTTMAVAAMIVAPLQFTRAIFRDDQQLHLMFSIALVLLSTIAWNYFNELLIALRMIRVASVLQFINAISFTAFAVALVVYGYKSEQSIIIAFGVSNLLSVVGALYVLIPVSRALSGPDRPLDSTDVWRKLLPFAAWVWQSNLLFNTFLAASPFMIKYLVQGDPLAVDKLVGQFSSSRAVPMIFMTVAAGIGTTVLPYLSHDWEAGRRSNVSCRMNTTLKLLALAFSLASAVVLLGAPILYGVILGGRYDGGLSLLPYTLTYCVWFSLIAVSQNFLWCVERAWLGCCALLAGLITNVAMSYVLLPAYGLDGSVAAVTAATLVALIMMYGFCSLHGLRIDSGTWIATLVPPLISFGGKWGAIAVIIGAVVLWQGTLLLNFEEKENVRKTIRNAANRILRRRSAMAR